MCDSDGVSNETEWKIKVLEDGKTYDPSKECKIGLCGFNGMFITAEADGSVVCDRTHCLGWERFTSSPLENGLIALKTDHNTFVSVGRDGGDLSMFFCFCIAHTLAFCA